jgi:hypothetical protein
MLDKIHLSDWLKKGEGIKENDGGWIQLWYIVRSFVNVTMYPPVQ